MMRVLHFLKNNQVALDALPVWYNERLPLSFESRDSLGCVVPVPVVDTRWLFLSMGHLDWFAYVVIVG